MKIVPLGDSALIVRLRERFEDAPSETLTSVLGTKRQLEQAQLPGVLEIAPSYTTIAVYFDPVAALEAGAPTPDIFAWYAQRIREALANAPEPPTEQLHSVEIPVCYAPQFGFDLEEVARLAGVDPGEVIRLHSAAEFRVHCLGFTPGFPYLSGLPPKLTTPRRSVPRKDIPAGSVAIGGRQTGIYPIKSPGGWNVIGRTPLTLFDSKRNPPARLRPGDRVRFRSISPEEFESWMT